MNTPNTLPGRISNHAAQFAGKIAIQCGAHEISYAQLESAANQVADALIRTGCRPGDRVAILADNHWRYPVAWLGILKAGCSAVPLPTLMTGLNLRHMLADSGATVLFVSGAMQPLADTATAISDTGALPLKLCVALNFEAAGYVGWARFLKNAATEPPAVEVLPNWEFNIIYSSGTTGVPKGICHAHHVRVAAAEAFAPYGFNTSTTTLVTTALYSNWSMGAMMYTLWFAGTLDILPKFTTQACLQRCAAQRPSNVFLVPVQLARLLDDPAFDNYALGDGTKKWCAGSPLAASRKREVLERWPGGLVEIYGMTEGAPFTLLDAAAHPDKLHTVGHGHPPEDIKIIAEDDTECTPGQTGEVVGRARSPMDGYNNQPQATEALIWRDADQQVWFRSGDIGRLDADGFLSILDRKKDMIISGGFNVYASDLEAVLLEHPAVAEVAVVGIPNSRWGETPLAVAVLRNHAVATEPDLLAFANARLAKFQRLAAVVINEALPRGTLGKVLKRELRDAYARNSDDTDAI